MLKTTVQLSIFIWVAILPVTVLGQFDSDEILQEREIFRKFGDIRPEQLRAEPNHDYPYEVLLREASVEFDEGERGIVAYIHYLNRIKVYTDDPVEQTEAALVGIPFYAADNIERVTNLEGNTWKPNGEVVRFDEENTRTVELNSRYRIVEFEMPEVEQGVILEYKYTLERRYIEELPDFYLSDRVPTKSAALYMKNADYLRFDVIQQNVDFDLQFREFNVDTSSIPLVFTYQRPSPVNVEVWRASDIPAVDAASYISSIDDVRAKLKFQISEFGLPRQPLENSWEFVAAQMRRTSNPYETVEENRLLIDQLSKRFTEIENQSVLQDSIFRFVNLSAQFNGVNAIHADGNLSHVPEGEPADQAEINTLLLGLLQNAGIDARALYISSRDFGRINRSFPSLYQFNRMLVTSDIDGTTYVMDGSYAHSLPDLIPVGAYNEQGFVLSDQEFDWMNITPQKSVFNLDITIVAELDTEGSLKGKLSAETTGYPSREIRRSRAGNRSNSEIVKEVFLDIYPDAKLNRTEIYINESDPNRIGLEADFEILNYAVSFSEGIEYRPMLVGYLYQNPFESTNRRVPITLDAPEQLSVNYQVELPESARSEQLRGRHSTELEGAQLKEEYDVTSDLLDYSFEIKISRKEFSADDYSQLRRIYQRWVELSNDVWFIEIEN